MVGIFISYKATAIDIDTGKVVSVIDGNTLEVAGKDKQIIKISLIGIDSPELDQEYGDAAKRFLEKIILQKEVTVQFKGKDRVGTHLAIVMIKGKVDPRVEMLKEGLAWTAETNPLEELEPYKVWAQRKSKGLWKQKNPIPPWTYRRKQAMERAKSS